MKVVINTCYGEFKLSKAAYKYLGIDEEDFDEEMIPRNDARLVECVESLGKAADAHCAKLKIVEIPDDVEWFIRDYGGLELIVEKHRTWC